MGLDPPDVGVLCTLSPRCRGRPSHRPQDEHDKQRRQRGSRSHLGPFLIANVESANVSAAAPAAPRNRRLEPSAGRRRLVTGASAALGRSSDVSSAAPRRRRGTGTNGFQGGRGLLRLC
jgi:hypothetical protein